MSRNLYLTGFMGAGKSSVGRLVAEELGRVFVDMDAQIEAREGRTIAALFEEAGEAYFRRLERQVLQELARQSGLVVATGGGVVEADENRDLMARTGEVVWLYCDLERSVSRALEQGSVRPLLAPSRADALERARRLWKRRQWWYARAPVWVDARSGEPAQVARRVIEALQWGQVAPTAAWVLGPGHAYPLVVGRGLIKRLGSIVGLLADRYDLGGTAFVVADRAVRAFAEQAVDALRQVGWRTALAEVGPGEAAKELDQLSALYEQARQANLDRTGLVVAVGGGAALDVAGFMAATYMRGVAWLSLPTTLLAQVDAAIGGKTGVNTPRAKNLVGAFHQPLAVVADLDALSGLPARQYAAGMAEVIKHGLVGDPWLWERLEAGAPGADVPGSLCQDEAELIARAAAVKALVVTEDPFEKGRRVVLNFGHTTAHALEAAGNFEQYLHGEAVAIGMVTAAMLSARLGVLHEPDLVARLQRTLVRHGLPVSAGRRPPDATLLWDLMGVDKKKQAGRRRWVLLEAPGQAVALTDAVGRDLFEEVWREQHRLEDAEGA